MTTLAFKRLHDAAKLPTRSHDSDVGLDLYPLEGLTIPPDQTRTIPIGIAVSIPPGHVGLIASRSSLGARGLDVHGGILDPGFVGEIKVVLHNDSFAYQGIGPGAVAQLLVIPILALQPTWVAGLPASSRGDAGFGSSDAAPGIGALDGDVS